MVNSQNSLKISDLLQGDLQLTTPPNIYFELQKVIDNPALSMEAAAAVIETDPALTIKLLKIVNSAFYGFASKIVNIKRAVSLIGATELQNLVLAAIIIDKFSTMPGGIISMQEFWAKSLYCGLIAKELACLKAQSSEELFVCGLLHHIGQLVFFRRIPELARSVLLAKQSYTDAEEIELETSIIGFNHYEAGAALAELWRLPDIIIESIRLHTTPELESPCQAVASLVRIANRYSLGNIKDMSLITDSLGLTKDHAELALAKSQEEFDVIFKIFYQN